MAALVASGHTPTERLLGVLLDRGEVELAIELAGYAFTVRPMVRMLVSRNRQARAIRFLHDVATKPRLRPVHVEHRMPVANLLADEGRWQEALDLARGKSWAKEWIPRRLAKAGNVTVLRRMADTGQVDARRELCPSAARERDRRAPRPAHWGTEQRGTDARRGRGGRRGRCVGGRRRGDRVRGRGDRDRGVGRRPEVRAAARRAADSAAEVARIASDLEHRQLRPELRCTFTVQHGGPGRPGSTARLVVVLDGPPDLDGVAVAIRDDRPDRAPVTAGAPTAADIAATAWGPWRFRPGVDGATRDGRVVPARPLRHREPLAFTLETTPVPHWMTPRDWADAHADAPLRLTFTCTRDGYRPWELHEDVDPRHTTPTDPRRPRPGPAATARWRAGDRGAPTTPSPAGAPGRVQAV
ncbi:hypothetical protein [Saccharothrix luteola]|uniref:hypothetical protein n=1 Tax=Saccharothrix luteola TaxID=2893018 RepID=UPI001E64A433|nr:hypothetical protein [Saccharothrix luteola]MCC8246969.1 hypothetical protein [Saccharothrix luteola]